MIATEYTLDGEPVDIDQFLRDNEETFTAEDVQFIRALAPGQSLLFGGGAAAEFVLRRKSTGDRK